MILNNKNSGTKARPRAFTLAEVLVAVSIVALLVFGNMAAAYQVRIMTRKDLERGIVSGFMQHYAEHVKALPFEQVMPNQPLSGLYSGLNNTPRITLPPNASWVSLTALNYQTFHPSLIVIAVRNPQMRVLIETTSAGAIAHDKHVEIEIQWDSPLKAGARVSRHFDLFRVKDL